MYIIDFGNNANLFLMNILLFFVSCMPCSSLYAVSVVQSVYFLLDIRHYTIILLKHSLALTHLSMLQLFLPWQEC